LSLPALETLAVVAYKQPITAPEIMDVRGVQGTGVLKTLLDRKLIAAAGRKNVMGKPILYKTTREFLIQFGLSSLAELPTLKEFEELGRLALSDGDEYAAEAAAPAIAEEGAMQEQSLLAETTKTVEAAETSAAETTDENTTPAELKEEDTAEEAASEQQTNG
jgi:segregation and condensation protein B